MSRGQERWRKPGGPLEFRQSVRVAVLYTLLPGESLRMGTKGDFSVISGKNTKRAQRTVFGRWIERTLSGYQLIKEQRVTKEK